MRSGTVGAVVFCVLTARHAFCQEDTAGTDSEEDGNKGNQHDTAEQHSFTDEELRTVHSDWDVNSDKEVSHQELINFVDKHKMNVLLDAIDAEDKLKRQDTSKDGLVTLEEHLKEDEGLEPQDREDKIELFKAADANGDGMLDKSEMNAILSPDAYEATLPVLVKHTMRKADQNADGKLSVEEFEDSNLSGKAVITVDGKDQEMSDDDVKNLFRKLDKNSDGSVDFDELQPLESGQIHREKVVDHFVKHLDKDGDKHVDYSELIQAKNFVHDSDLQDYLVAWAQSKQFLGR